MRGLQLALMLGAVLATSTVAPAADLPRHGVLVPGRTLAGVRLGETAAGVQLRWGSGYRICRLCAERTWYFSYEHGTGEPLGVGVTFHAGRVSAVFTLGAPFGWRTREGLRLGESIDRVRSIYGRLAWSSCIGYVAMSMRRPGVVTSIYATGESV